MYNAMLFELLYQEYQDGTFVQCIIIFFFYLDSDRGPNPNRGPISTTGANLIPHRGPVSKHVKIETGPCCGMARKYIAPDV